MELPPTNLNLSPTSDNSIPASPSPLPISSSSLFSTHKILIPVLILTVVALTGLLLWKFQYSQSNQTTDFVSTPTPIISSSPTPNNQNQTDPQTGWEIYQDVRYGYSIDIPPDWYIMPTASEGYGAFATFTNYNPEKVNEGFTPDMIKIQISLFDKPSEQSFSEWTWTSIQESLQSSANKDYGMKVVSEKPITINNIEGKVYTFGYNTEPSSLLIHLPKTPNKIFVTTVHPANSNHLITFDQILSTFKYLN